MYLSDFLLLVVFVIFTGYQIYKKAKSKKAVSVDTADSKAFRDAKRNSVSPANSFKPYRVKNVDVYTILTSETGDIRNINVEIDRHIADKLDYYDRIGESAPSDVRICMINDVVILYFIWLGCDAV